MDATTNEMTTEVEDRGGDMEGRIQLERLDVGRAVRELGALFVVGGALLGWLGLRRRDAVGALAGTCGAALLYAGIRNMIGSPRRSPGVTVQRSMTINRPRSEVYAFWTRLENLPRFMRHIAEVETIDDRRSRWAFELPGLRKRLEWVAETTQTIENRRISWRSLPGSDVDTSGEVVFEDAPGSLGTELHVRISYRAPAGEAGRLAAKAFNPAFQRLVREDIRRAKHVLETDELPVSTGRRGRPAATAFQHPRS